MVLPVPLPRCTQASHMPLTSALSSIPHTCTFQRTLSSLLPLRQPTRQQPPNTTPRLHPHEPLCPCPSLLNCPWTVGAGTGWPHPLTMGALVVTIVVGYRHHITAAAPTMVALPTMACPKRRRKSPRPSSW